MTLTVIVALAGSQDALVMVSELNQVYSVTFAEVRVHFFAALKVKKTDREIIGPRDEVLAIMRDVHRVNLLLLQNS